MQAGERPEHHHPAPETERGAGGQRGILGGSGGHGAAGLPMGIQRVGDRRGDEHESNAGQCADDQRGELYGSGNQLGGVRDERGGGVDGAAASGDHGAAAERDERNGHDGHFQRLGDGQRAVELPMAAQRAQFDQWCADQRRDEQRADCNQYSGDRRRQLHAGGKQCSWRRYQRGGDLDGDRAAGHHRPARKSEHRRGQ